MIRKFDKKDIDRVMQIWLESNIQAHSFIDEKYWNENFDTVKSTMLEAKIYVDEENGEILGFVGMMGDYLAGIFVDKDYRGKRIGKKLLNYIKESYSKFSLDVYEKNQGALNFYLREGMTISSEGLDTETGEKEYRMIWRKEK